MPQTTAKTQKKERRLRGLGVSPGLGRARAWLVFEGIIVPKPRKITEEDFPAEWRRFRRAVAKTAEQIRELKHRIDSAGRGVEVGIFDAHLLMLQDEVMIGEVKKAMREEFLSPGNAFYQVYRRYASALSSAKDDYLSERAADFHDLAQRLLRNLARSAPVAKNRNKAPHTIVAHDLLPSDTAKFDAKRVRALVTAVGSPTSHTAIIARSLGIPAVVGLGSAVTELENGDDILVDGYRGLVIVNPKASTLRAYDRLESSRSKVRDSLLALRDEPATTRDNRRIILSANIEFLREIPTLLEQGAEGIGLYRTEFLYLRSDRLPTEKEQTESYSQALKKVKGEGVIFRTCDIGGDKLPSTGRREPEPNPFLGWRGIRFSLEEREIFKTQIRAILRASVHGTARIMFPMVSSRAEVREARGVVAECMGELAREGLPFDREIEIGAMIEIPAAALTADLIAPEVDFFSIGTNDLTQYAIAVDRINDKVAGLLDPMHPGVLRLIQMTVEAARKAGIWTGVCGEAAGDLLYLPLLIGLGIDELSVGPRQVLSVKRAIRALDAAECQALVARMLSGMGTSEVREECEKVARKLYGDLLD